MVRGGESLGVTYDEVYVVRLKHPAAPDEKSRFSLRGKSDHRVDSVFKVRPQFHKRIDTLFHPEADFDNGLSDSKLQLYALVFYREGSAVLSVSPNLVGGDLYASDKKGFDPRTLSLDQRNEFLELVFITLAISDQVAELPQSKPKPKKDRPKERQRK
jgi:hypothetical protein